MGAERAARGGTRGTATGPYRRTRRTSIPPMHTAAPQRSTGTSAARRGLSPRCRRCVSACFTGRGEGCFDRKANNAFPRRQRSAQSRIAAHARHGPGWLAPPALVCARPKRCVTACRSCEPRPKRGARVERPVLLALYQRAPPARALRLPRFAPFQALCRASRGFFLLSMECLLLNGPHHVGSGLAKALPVKRLDKRG